MLTSSNDEIKSRSILHTIVDVQSEKDQMKMAVKEEPTSNQKRLQSTQSDYQDILKDHITGPKWQRLETCAYFHSKFADQMRVNAIFT